MLESSLISFCGILCHIYCYCYADSACPCHYYKSAAFPPQMSMFSYNIHAMHFRYTLVRNEKNKSQSSQMEDMNSFVSGSSFPQSCLLTEAAPNHHYSIPCKAWYCACDDIKERNRPSLYHLPILILNSRFKRHLQDFFFSAASSLRSPPMGFPPGSLLTSKLAP